MVVEASVSPHHSPVASFAKLLPAASERVRKHPCDLHCSFQGCFSSWVRTGKCGRWFSTAAHNYLLVPFHGLTFSAVILLPSHLRVYFVSPQEEKGDDTNPQVVLGSCTCSNHAKTFTGIGVFGLFLQHKEEGMRREIVLGLIQGCWCE